VTARIETPGAGDDGKVPTFDETTGNFLLETPSGGGGSSTLDGLTDVVITAAASGDILRHNGTNWVDTPGTTHYDAAGTAATAVAALSTVYQPLDSDLTAIAALTTTGTGRSLLAAADAAAIRTIAGAEASGTAATAVAAHEADSTSVHGIANTANLLTTSSGIDALSDVTITAAASGDILRHNGTAWVDAVGTTHFEVAGAVATHEADTTSVHGIADTSALVTTSSAPELIRDTMATALVQGSGVTITVNDGADTITIAASGGASANGMTQHARTGGGWWHGPPNSGSPSGTAWPIIDRLYGTPFAWAQAVTISALAVNVTAAGAAGVVLRIAVFALENGIPTTLLAQGTVAGDSTGTKTLTLGSPIAVAASTPIIVFVGPQGVGAAGSAWYATLSLTWGFLPENGASWAGGFQQGMYVSASGALLSNPSFSVEGNNRYPYVVVRLS
jgi:hypothetical protein